MNLRSERSKSRLPLLLSENNIYNLLVQYGLSFISK